MSCDLNTYREMVTSIWDVGVSVWDTETPGVESFWDVADVWVALEETL